MIPALETPRLVLRPLQLDDAPRFQLLFPRWEIVRYLTSRVPWPYPPNGASTFIRDVALPAMEKGDWWQWTLRLKSDADLIVGSISLSTGENNNRGFWLGEAWQGQGLMTEAAHAVTDCWFNVLGKPVLRVPKAIPNTSSRRISEKQGMRVIAVEDRDYVGGRFPTEIWELTRDEWNARA